MNVPPHGLCIPAAWSRVIRADQIELIVEQRRRIRVDLLDCRAPGPATDEGRTAIRWMEAWLEEAADLPLSLWLPLGPRLDDVLIRLRQPHTFGRVFAGTQDLGELLVAHGLAEP